VTLYRILANPRSETVLRWAWRLGAVAVVCGLLAQVVLLVSAHRTASAAALQTREMTGEEQRLRTVNREIRSQLTGTIHLDDRLESDQYLASFVHQLGQTASDSLVNLITVQADPGSVPAAQVPLEGESKPEAGPKWETIPVSIEVTGTFTQLMSFLDKLCDLPKPVEPTDVDISLATVDRCARVVTVEMRAALSLHRMEHDG
jgi:Tfp pilus assembly protein PilO